MSTHLLYLGKNIRAEIYVFNFEDLPLWSPQCYFIFADNWWKEDSQGWVRPSWFSLPGFCEGLTQGSHALADCAGPKQHSGRQADPHPGQELQFFRTFASVFYSLQYQKSSILPIFILTVLEYELQKEEYFPQIPEL